MKKLLLSLSLLTATYVCSFAQSSMATKGSIGAEIGVPVGTADQVYSLTEGVSLKVEIPVTPRGLNVTVTGGFTIFDVNSRYSGYINNAQYIPLTVGLKNYFQDSPMFLELDGGVSINTNSNYTTNSTVFVYSPGLGASLAQNSVDISVRYEGRVESGGTVGQAALRVAFKFGGK